MSRITPGLIAFRLEVEAARKREIIDKLAAEGVVVVIELRRDNRRLMPLQEEGKR